MWKNPKTDWKPGDGIKAVDLNRIEGNTDSLYRSLILSGRYDSRYTAGVDITLLNGQARALDWANNIQPVGGNIRLVSLRLSHTRPLSQCDYFIAWKNEPFVVSTPVPIQTAPPTVYIGGSTLERFPDGSAEGVIYLDRVVEATSVCIGMIPIRDVNTGTPIMSSPGITAHIMVGVDINNA